ncbi:MAG: hypothetical protein KBD37_05260 [Burkholderiales bacterium]|nr:hypothetical protein [Burkholderiales bacterium]
MKYGIMLLLIGLISNIILSGCNSGGTTPASGTHIYCTSNNINGSQRCILFSENNTYSYGFNNMPYALCSQVLCKMVDSSATTATCICPVITTSGWQSASLSPVNYVLSQPTWNLNGSLQTIQSDYSLANFPPQPQLCSFSTPKPWAYCLGVRCRVSSDEQNAVCNCPVKYSTAFIFEESSSKCNTSADNIWSAAPTDGSGYDNMKLIYTQLYPNAPVLAD